MIIPAIQAGTNPSFPVFNPMPVGNQYIDAFKVRNATANPITLGDLVNVTVLPGQTLDLLKQPRVTKDKINQSQALQIAFRTGVLVRVEGPAVVGKTLDERAATIADELLATGGGAGNGVIGADGAIGATGAAGSDGVAGATGPSAASTSAYISLKSQRNTLLDNNPKNPFDDAAYATAALLGTISQSGITFSSSGVNAGKFIVNSSGTYSINCIFVLVTTVSQPLRAQILVNSVIVYQTSPDQSNILGIAVSSGVDPMEIIATIVRPLNVNDTIEFRVRTDPGQDFSFKVMEATVANIFAVAGAVGATGPSGGPVGPAGVTGVTGTDGAIGATGPSQGPIGLTGETGVAGVDASGSVDHYASVILNTNTNNFTLEINPFDEGNHTSFSATTVSSGITYNSITGEFTVSETGIYDISCTWILTSSVGEISIQLKIKADAVTFFDFSYGIEQSGFGGDSVERTIRILKSLTAGEKVTFFIDPTGPTMSVRKGTTATIIKANLLGNVGATGTDGVTGPSGGPGIDGIDGATGPIGATGPFGGPPGPMGPAGATGPEGTQTYISVSTQDDTTLVSLETNPFDEKDYPATTLGITTHASNGITLDKTTGLFTVSSTGTYVIRANLILIGGATPSRYIGRIKVNGLDVWSTSDFTPVQDIAQYTTTVGPLFHTWDLVRNLNANDTVSFTFDATTSTIDCRQNSTATIFKLTGAGPAGATGAAGTDGTNGTNGAAGATGPIGATGPSGTDGSAGSVGAVGATGPVACSMTLLGRMAEITNPTATDIIKLGYFCEAATITEIRGSTDAGSVIFNVYYQGKASPGATGVVILSSDMEAGSTGADHAQVGFSTTAIPAESFITYRASGLGVTGVPSIAWINICADVCN